jgi:Fe-S-cluster containining protein
LTAATLTWPNFAMNSPVSPELQAAFDREREGARSSAPSRAQTVGMYGRLAALQRDVIARGKVAVTCTRGCSYCCHLRVEIRPHDAFVLAEHIRTRFTAEQRAGAIARIEENLQRIAPLTPEQHIRAGIPCALLQEGICSVYEGRPATCRKYYSVSVETCRNAFNDTSAPLTGEIEDEQVRLAGNAVALGYAKGLEDVGYDATLYELHYALHSALTNSGAETLYSNRQRPFV